METTHPFRFANRGPSSLVRLIFFISVSILLIFVDLRYRSLESTRRTLSLLVAPVQRLAVLPEIYWDQLRERLYKQDSLARANDRLEQLHALDIVSLQRMQGLEAENRRLRSLIALPPLPGYHYTAAEMLYRERDVFKRHIWLNKGSSDNIQPGQVVLDEKGVVGQITRVHPLLSEVSLITDKEQAVPVQIQRNGLRTFVQGTGNTINLSIRYLPTTADIRLGDVLTTSGLDGIYPLGLPVGQVAKIDRDPSYPFARILCVPLGGVEHGRHFLILSSLPKLPDIPPEPSVEKPSKGKRAKNGG